MRLRRASGVLLPGLLFTALGCAGVVMVYGVAAPSLPDLLSGSPFRERSQRTPPHVEVTVPPTPSRSPSPSPRATRPPRPEPATPTVRTPRPSPTRTAGRSPTAAAVPTTVRCRPGSRVVSAVADSYVDQAKPTVNYGSAESLLVAGRDKNRNVRALIRFALPQVPAGCALRGATLTLTPKEQTGRRLVVRRVAGAWDERRVTWASAPAAAGSASAATVSGGTVTWTVTGQVQAMLAGADHGFVLAEAAENSSGDAPQTNFHARTGRRPPTLTVTWS